MLQQQNEVLDALHKKSGQWVAPAYCSDGRITFAFGRSSLDEVVKWQQQQVAQAEWYATHFGGRPVREHEEPVIGVVQYQVRIENAHMIEVDLRAFNQYIR